MFSPRDGLWLATVPVAQCDRLAEVTTVADYRGHTCQVVSIDEDGTTGLYYLGENRANRRSGPIPGTASRPAV